MYVCIYVCMYVCLYVCKENQTPCKSLAKFYENNKREATTKIPPCFFDFLIKLVDSLIASPDR